MRTKSKNSAIDSEWIGDAKNGSRVDTSTARKELAAVYDRCQMVRQAYLVRLPARAEAQVVRLASFMSCSMARPKSTNRISRRRWRFRNIARRRSPTFSAMPSVILSLTKSSRIAARWRERR